MRVTGVILGNTYVKGLLTLLLSSFLSCAWANSAKETAAIQQRIAPIGKVNVVDDTADVKAAANSKATPTQTTTETPKTATSQRAATPAGKAELKVGQKIYQTYCFACHASGLAGAPKLGDKAAWTERLQQGMQAMLNNVKKGMGAMPPKGTCATCTDQQLLDAINYMLAESETSADKKP